MGDHQRDRLPIPDFDHLPVGSVASRIRSLDERSLEALVAYEEQHAARAPVLLVLRQRLVAVRAGAEQSGGDPAAETRPEAARDSADREGANPSTAGPPVNPPSHGVPTNPAQPRG
jgi:hypothetical protein